MSRESSSVAQEQADGPTPSQRKKRRPTTTRSRKQQAVEPEEIEESDDEDQVDSASIAKQQRSKSEVKESIDSDQLEQITPKQHLLAQPSSIQAKVDQTSSSAEIGGDSLDLDSVLGELQEALAEPDEPDDQPAEATNIHQQKPSKKRKLLSADPNEPEA